MKRLTYLLLLTFVCLGQSACVSLPFGGPPTVSQGHAGQLVLASAQLKQGQPLLDYARGLVEHVQAVNSAMQLNLDNGNFLRAKRRAFDMVEVLDPEQFDPAEPGLRVALEQAIAHLRLAASAEDASGTLRQQSQRIAVQAETTLDGADTLITYCQFALNADSAESLAIIAEEVDSQAISLLANAPQAPVSGLAFLEGQVRQMLDGEKRSVSGSQLWYLENFEAQADQAHWAYKRKPMAASADIFASDNDGSFGSSGHGDDDDDDDDDDD